MTWAWDDPLERARVESDYLSRIHQQYIDENPEFIPGCSCHPRTREARLAIKELQEAQ